MNKFLFSVALVCGLLTANAYGQSDSKKKSSEGNSGISCSCCKIGGAETTSPIILVLDLDKDGQISPIEMKNAAQSLSALDTNSDGTVSRKEMHEHSLFNNTVSRHAGKKNERKYGASARQSCNVMLRKYDQNNNKQLEIEEMPDAMLMILDRIDANGDQIMTEDELMNINKTIVATHRPAKTEATETKGETLSKTRTVPTAGKITPGSALGPKVPAKSRRNSKR